MYKISAQQRGPARRARLLCGVDRLDRTRKKCGHGNPAVRGARGIPDSAQPNKRPGGRAPRSKVRGVRTPIAVLDTTSC